MGLWLTFTGARIGQTGPAAVFFMAAFREFVVSFLKRAGLKALCGVAGVVLAGCIGAPPSSSGNGSAVGGAVAGQEQRRVFPLDSLKTSTITVAGKPIRVWLTQTPAQHEEGLMWVGSDRLTDDQGMLFVFQSEEYRAFWMRNTLIPLDIAYMRGDGRVVKTWTMPAMTMQTFPSEEPAMFALEMKAGSFARLGLKVGDVISIPTDVFK